MKPNESENKSEEEDFEVEKIIKHEIRPKEDESETFEIQYRVKWKGFPHAENQWMSAQDLENCNDLLDIYWKAHEKEKKKAEKELEDKNQKMKSKEKKSEEQATPQRHTRKRKRVASDSSGEVPEDQTKTLEPSPKRRRGQNLSGTTDSNDDELTIEAMEKIKNFEWRKFGKAFCQAYNKKASEPIGTFWKNYKSSQEK